MVLLLTGLTAWLLSPLPPDSLPATLAGQARIYDGDTIGLADSGRGHVRVRLEGLDAPELAQTCTDATGKPWDCGLAARRHLQRLIDGGRVTCETAGYDRYGRVLANCARPTGGLGAALVLAGMAVADGRYGEEERRARAAGAGIWAGPFERPAEWRRAHPREEAEAMPPSLLATFLNWVGNVLWR